MRVVCCRKEREEEERIQQASKNLHRERKKERMKQRYADWSDADNDADDRTANAKSHVSKQQS